MLILAVQYGKLWVHLATKSTVQPGTAFDTIKLAHKGLKNEVYVELFISNTYIRNNIKRCEGNQ